MSAMRGRTILIAVFLLIAAALAAGAAENGAAKNKKPAPPADNAEKAPAADSIPDKLLFVRTREESQDLWLWSFGEKPKLVARDIGEGKYLVLKKPPILIYQVAIDEQGPYKRFGLALRTFDTEKTGVSGASQIEYIDKPGEGFSDFNPAISPDGAMLIFTRVRIDRYGTADYDAGLWFCPLSGGAGKAGQGRKGAQPKAALFWKSPQNNPGILHVPTGFSPDGKLLIVQRSPVAAGDIGDTLVFDVKTRKIVRTYLRARVETWLPGGKKILASRIESGAGRRLIYIGTQNIEDWKPVTPDGVSDGEPAVSPDGRRLVVHARDESGESLGLWVVDIKSGERKQIAENAAAPRWSADGKRVYFNRRDESTEWVSQVWYVEPDGGELRMLIENADRFRLYLAGPGGGADEKGF